MCVYDPQLLFEFLICGSSCRDAFQLLAFGELHAVDRLSDVMSITDKCMQHFAATNETHANQSHVLIHCRQRLSQFDLQCDRLSLGGNKL